ncbi:MAG: flagellar biosynthesis repressor FlbT [Pseudomonadota bacterium]
MGGLILKLRPHEELMINGVVVENGERNTRLRVKTEGAHILRLRDALRPEEATTPLRRAYYIAQLAVAGQISNTEAAAILTKALGDQPDLVADDEISDCIARHDFYQVMRMLKELAFAGRDQAAVG